MGDDNTPNDEDRPRRKGWAANVGLVLGSILVVLLLGEAAVRVLGYAPEVKLIGVGDEDSAYRRSDNPLLGFELKPNYRNPDADFSRTYPAINSHGQRDVERAIEKPAGVRRVILLGDSVVEGHDVRDLDGTISRRLEALYPDGKTEVLNFGVSGYCTLAEVELLRVKGLRFDPDVVVLLFVGNDFDNFNREAFDLEAAGRRPGWTTGLFSLSHLFRVVSLRFDLFGFGAQLDPVGWNARSIGDNNVVQGLELLEGLAEQHGFKPVIAVWPAFDDEKVFDLHPMPGGRDDLVIEQLAARHGFPVVRLSRYFRSVLAGGGDDANPRIAFTVGDGLHPSARGCAVAARALRDVLDRLEAGALPAAPPRPAGEQDLRAAIEASRSLGSATPGYAAVHNNTALALAAEGKLEEAAGYFRKALEQDPGLSAARNNLARTLLALGRRDEAIDQYRAAMDQDPWSAEVPYNLGLALRNGGDAEGALAAFHRAVDVRPDYVDAQLALANLLADRREMEHAIEHYEKVLAVDTGRAPVHANLGMAFAAAGKLDRAIEHLREAIRLDPEHARAHHNLGNALVSTGDVRGGLEHYREAARLEPEWTPPLRSMTMLLATRREVSDPAEAVRVGERAAELSGRRDPLILDTLALAYLAARRPADAIAAEREALALARSGGAETLAASIAKRLAELEKRAAAGARQSP